MEASLGELDGILAAQRAAFSAEGPPPLAVRRGRIDALLSVLLDGADQLAAAMSEDFGTRPRSVSISLDVFGSLVDIAHTRSHLARWMKPTKKMRLAMAAGLRASVCSQPLGVVGIVAPWNFPVNLAVVPAASALAAGNRVMIKMSETTPRTAEVFANLVSRRISPDVLTVVTGGPDIAAAFSGLDLDHLFFTGSAQTGRLVMRRAADNLVPVTLELGGKNPAVVGSDADFEEAAERIARARLTNAGQVCLCPEYTFVPAARVDEFVDRYVSAVRRIHPSILDDDNYCSVVNDAAFDRILGLVADARQAGATVTEIVPPGEVLPDRARRKIAPTVLTGVTPAMKVAHDEVFGPVLTVYGYDHVGDVLDYVNARSAPLAAYWYGPRSADYARFSREIRCGGITRNDFSLHAALPDLPFGGVGDSGMGAYHGKAGFDTFSHRRAVVESNLPMSVGAMASAAPVTATVDTFVRAYARLTRFRLRGVPGRQG